MDRQNWFNQAHQKFPKYRKLTTALYDEACRQGSSNFEVCISKLAKQIDKPRATVHDHLSVLEKKGLIKFPERRIKGMKPEIRLILPEKLLHSSGWVNPSSCSLKTEEVSESSVEDLPEGGQNWSQR